MNTPTSDTINSNLLAQLDGQPIPPYRSEEFARLLIALAYAATDRIELERIGLDTTRLLLERAEASTRAQREVELMTDRGRALC